MTLEEAANRVLALFREVSEDGIRIYTDDQDQIFLIRRERTADGPTRLVDNGSGVLTSDQEADRSVILADTGNGWEKVDW